MIPAGVRIFVCSDPIDMRCGRLVECSTGIPRPS